MPCVLQLSRALSFKQQLETADATLRHFVKQGFLDGMKLVSLASPDVDDEENQPPNDDPTQMPLVDQSDSDPILTGSYKAGADAPQLNCSVLFDRMLVSPVDNLPDEQLLQPIELKSCDEPPTTFDEPESVTLDPGDDDDQNTLLQPLETHQLPRDDDDMEDEDDDEDEDETEPDFIDDDDTLSPSEPSKEPSVDGEQECAGFPMAESVEVEMEDVPTPPLIEEDKQDMAKTKRKPSKPTKVRNSKSSSGK